MNLKATFKNFEELKEKALSLGISVKEHSNGLVNLTYSQIETPKFDEFGKKCRGLVIDKELNVVCHPFHRFFNYGEDPNFNENDFEGKNIAFYEKLDGSLIKIYFYEKENKWLLGTKGQVVAETNVGSLEDFTFKDLVLKSLNLKSEEDLQDFLNKENLDKNLTYLFEVTSFYNSPVVPHKEPKLWFLASLNKDGKVIEAAEQKSFNSSLIHFPKKFDFKNVKQAFDLAQDLPFNEEGYVVYLDNQPSFKIKSPAYVAVHLMKNKTASEKNIVNLVVLREEEEYLTYFPTEREHIQPYSLALIKLEEDCLNTFKQVKDIENRKEFALNPLVKNSYFSSILFNLKNKVEKNELNSDNESELTHCFFEHFNKLPESTQFKLIIKTMEIHKLPRTFHFFSEDEG